MTFGHPWLLLALAIPILLCLWEFTRTGTRLVMPFDHGQQREGKWLRRLMHFASFLPPLLMAVAIVILARPLRLAQPKQERTLTNIEFVMDVSGSMMSPFGEGSRYDAAMNAIEQFTTHRKGDAFGLTIFGNEVLRWTPLTTDLSAIRNATPFLRPELLPHHFGGTEIGKAVKFCRTTLADRRKETNAEGLIILLSDGYSADLGPEVSREIAGDLAADGIRLYAIHIGEGSPPSDLSILASPTDGDVYAADNPEALTEVFNRIDQMQPVRLKPTARHKVDAFGPFALAGLVILGVCQLTFFRLRYTPW